MVGGEAGGEVKEKKSTPEPKEEMWAEGHRETTGRLKRRGGGKKTTQTGREKQRGRFHTDLLHVDVEKHVTNLQVLVRKSSVTPARSEISSSFILLSFLFHFLLFSH